MIQELNHNVIPELYSYPFVINLDRGVGSCNAINDLLKICVPNKTRFKSQRVQHDNKAKILRM